MKMIDVVLTSLINNDNITDELIKDISNRFKIKVEKEKLIQYLAAYESNQDVHTAHVW